MATLAAIIKDYHQRPIKVVRATVAEMSSRTMARTRVKTGSLRASWNGNNGRPVGKNVNISGANPFAARNDFISVVNSLQVGDRYSFANTQPYARKIEYKYDHMRDTTVAEFQSIARASARGV